MPQGVEASLEIIEKCLVLSGATPTFMLGLHLYDCAVKFSLYHQNVRPNCQAELSV